MNRKEDILDNIRVATPCRASWDGMDGDERVRFCGACRLHVYNLTEMSREEATRLVADTEGRLCVRFHRRADGTVLTRDCPVGIRMMRRRLATAVSGVFMVFLAVAAFAVRPGGAAGDSDTESSLVDRLKVKVRQIEPFRTVLNWLDPPPRVSAGHTGRFVVMGAMAYRPSITTSGPSSGTAK